MSNFLHSAISKIIRSAAPKKRAKSRKRDRSASEKAVPYAVSSAIRKAFPKDADEILKEIRYDHLNGNWFFNRWGMYVGVESDGYIHT